MDTSNSVGEVVNVGNTEEVSIEGLARLVKERTGSSSAIEFIPYAKAYEPGFEDMMRRVPCVDKLHALTGFRPQTPLNEIIDRVTAFFKSRTPRPQSPPAKTATHVAV
jgi:UDP-glucose 4-epimerase